MPVAENHHRDWKPARALAVPLLLLSILVGFYWKLVLSDQYTWLDSPDFAYQVLPWYQFEAGEWHAGKVPLWDPYEWGGQSLIGQAQPGVAYPLNWLLFLIPLRHGWIRQWAMHWYFVLIHYMGALFCYLLCRDLKRSRAASLLAALGFALAGWVGNTDWPQMLNGAVWAPLVFLFLLRAARDHRPVASAALAGSCLGISFLSGHHQIPIFITLTTAGTWLYLIFQKGRLNRRALGLAAIFGVFLVLVSAVQTLPAAEYGTLSVRWVGATNPVGWKDPVPYYVHAEYSLYPLSILGIILPGLHHHSNPYMGFVLVAFAILAITAAWREGAVRLFATVAAGGLFFSLSSYSVFHGVIYALIPMVEKARSANMAIFIFNFAMVVLAAYGIDYFRESGWTPRIVKVLAGAGALLYFLVTAFIIIQTQRTVDFEKLSLSALCALLLAALLYAWRRERIQTRTGITLAILLMLVEMYPVAGFAWAQREKPDSMLRKLSEHADLAQFLRTQRQPVRVELDDKEIPYNFGDWYGIDVFGGYLASLTTAINNVQGDYQGRMLFATNFWIGKKPLRDNQVEVYTGRAGFKIYSNPEAFPRVWTVHQVVGIKSSTEVPDHLRRPIAELRQQAFVTGAPPKVDACPADDDAVLKKRDSDRVVIEANLRCRGMVVLAEAFYPGWQATVDGRPAQIYDAYSILRGVVVDGGQHRIEMRYRPRSVYLGAVLSGVGLLGALLLAAVFKR